MDLLEGGSLLNVIRKMKNYPEELVIKLMRQLCEAVAYLHKQGIVHRDLKLENLMLSSSRADAVLKVVDFGLATRTIDQKKGTVWKMKSIVGTPGFVAPEVLSGNKAPYGAEVDMFGVGCIVYQLLSSRLPFPVPGNLENLQAAIMKTALKFKPTRVWDHVSAECKDFISRCLEKDPTKRLKSEEALAHPWLQVRTMRTKLSSSAHQGILHNPDKQVAEGEEDDDVLVIEAQADSEEE